jgi:hypothetical protein
MTCAQISGFVYNDANNNGLLDPGEIGISGNTLELHDALGKLVASTLTDPKGAYVFSTDPHIDTSPATKEYDIHFPSKATDWTASDTVAQFDPSLGTLTSVEVISSDMLSTTVKIENLDTSPATINAAVSGTATLTGPSFTGLVMTQSVDKAFNAGAFDGVMDFAGPDSKVFDPTSAPGSNSIVLTKASDLAPFIGTGKVPFTGSTQSSSKASGSANLLLQVNTTVSADVRVIYHYTPSNCLPKGDYTIVQPVVPAGYLNGLKTSGNITPIAGSNTVNFIHVTLGMDSLPNNNFGEVKPASVGGTVYYDANDNGVKDPGDRGIAGIGVTLTGIDDLGKAINATQTTGTDDSYNFTNLRPGIYALSEKAADGYIDGSDNVGNLGGVATVDQFANIKLASGAVGVNYNFGELLPSSLSGFVYLDQDNNGIKEPGEPGIGGVTVTLTGTNDRGTPVNMAVTTAADGSYAFGNLRPGTYVITRIHPNGYFDGKDTIGTPGGITSPGQFSDIQLPPGLIGLDNDFAELLPPSQAVPTPPPPPPPTTPPPFLGKAAFLASSVLHHS